MGSITSVCSVYPSQKHDVDRVSNALPPLRNGGTVGALAAFLVVAGGVFTQVLVMAEMASM